MGWTVSASSNGMASSNSIDQNLHSKYAKKNVSMKTNKTNNTHTCKQPFYSHYAGRPVLVCTFSRELEDFIVGAKFYYRHALADANWCTRIREKTTQFSSVALTTSFPYHSNKPPHHNRFTALFPGPSGWAGARRELLDFMVQGKINTGRHTDHPAGRHFIQTKQCPPPPSPHILYRPDALPAAQPTASKHWRQQRLHTIQTKFIHKKQWTKNSNKQRLMYHVGNKMTTARCGNCLAAVSGMNRSKQHKCTIWQEQRYVTTCELAAVTRTLTLKNI